jgi:hypothetical protein
MHESLIRATIMGKKAEDSAKRALGAGRDVGRLRSQLRHGGVLSDLSQMPDMRLIRDYIANPKLFETLLGSAAGTMGMEEEDSESEGEYSTGSE